ncbi:hypothetical protein [Streptomyces fuscichromogenes]|uniref:Uncharacterized protein n=1 Tax=Streptomyces fuscichromogenes TaxID=1324013 RepID=A0A917XG77_9ACTN|nr:hypothetical protein [Streptomyces fuscichromogenes]GGN21871.1 hypothetical protein GCM10011578_053300 [Streptomyces fuscichromogenes]
MSWHQFEQVDDNGRILFSDDPALRLECVLMVLETAEGTITLDPAQTRHMPTALFEFRHALGVGEFGYVVPEGASLDGIPEEPQIESAILFGMRRLPPEFSDLRLPDRPGSGDDGVHLDEKRPTIFDELRMREPLRRDPDEVSFGMRRRPPGYVDLRSIPGWELHEIPDEQPKLARRLGYTYSRLELRTPDGEIYSRTWVPHDPEWATAALRHGYVVCLCGVELGIRAPYAMSDAQHTPGMRYESFRHGCAVGLTVGGLVAYVDHR